MKRLTQSHFVDAGPDVNPSRVAPTVGSGIFDFPLIRARMNEIQAERARPSVASASESAVAIDNLRDFIESDTKWWPDGVVTDGADHFIINRVPTMHNK